MANKAAVKRCQACGQLIRFVRTENGKAMPCNADPVRYREGGTERVITSDGITKAVTIVDDEKEADGFGFIPHFADCKSWQKG